MATSAKCGNGQRSKKQTQKPTKQKGQILKNKVKKKCPIVKLPKLSLSACLGVTDKKKTMVDLKSAYVALEYKHYHNIGSRRAAEQVITYDESVPIYESRFNTQTDHNSNRTLPNANLCGKASTEKVHQQQKCNINCSSTQVSPKQKKSNGMSKKLKETPKKVKKKNANSLSTNILDTSVPVRREASLNAKAKLNIFYYETDPVKGSDCVDSSEDEVLSTVAKSLPVTNSPDKACEKQPASPTAKRKVLQTEKSHKKCKKSDIEKPSESSKSPVSKVRKESATKTVKSPSKRTADSAVFSEAPKYARRMASLNAEAIMAVTGASFQNSTQKAARTEVLEAARTKVYVSPKKDLGRWVEGRGEELIQAKNNGGLIQWTNRELVKEIPIKDGSVGSTTDPLRLSDNPIPPLDRPANVDRPKCHTYQSPIHVNVEDCGPYVGAQPHIAAPLPRYSFSPAHSVAPTAQCQSYTLAGLGSLSNVQMVPFHQTYNSAFSVPCNHNINVPCNHGSACSLASPYYGYVHNNYYPSGGSLLQPLPEPCIIPRPHPLPVQCPQAEVKVLIHNPHSEHPFITPHEDQPIQAPIKVESITPSPIYPVEQKETECTPNKKVPGLIQNDVQSKPKPCKQKPSLKNKLKQQDGVPESSKKKTKKKKEGDVVDGKKVTKSSFKKKTEEKTTGKKKKLSEVKAKEKKKEDKTAEKKAKKQTITEGPLKASKVTVTASSGMKTDDKANKKTCKSDSKSGKQEDGGKSGRKEEKGKKKEATSSQKEESPSKAKKKRVDNHGWSWLGVPDLKVVHSPRESPPLERQCYPAMKHCDGDEVHTGDCVLLCSGPRKADIPYVAKVTNLWENGDDGEMMMSLLWYYRPEHTETGRRPNHMDCEVFASKHKDENSVACIEDKCYVLTYNEYCRYRADLRYTEEGCYRRPKVVPEPEEPYARSARLPPLDADPEIVLLCRQVYDFRQKRILKNPS